MNAPGRAHSACLQRISLGLLALALLAAPSPSAAAGPTTQEVDLLAAHNGNFETEEPWRYPPDYPENVAWWRIWRVVDNCKPADDTLNYACEPNGFYKESLPNGAAFIRTGSGSVTTRNNWDPWEAGVKQTLDVPAGSYVQLTAYNHLWTAQTGWNDSIPPPPSDTSVLAVSRVGIEPDGVDYPAAGSHVIWSGTVSPHDTWQAASVSAIAGPSGKVTVILYTSYRGYSRNFMTASWDDASLTVVSFTSRYYLPAISRASAQP